MSCRKHEGDGTTPRGCFKLLFFFVRNNLLFHRKSSHQYKSLAKDHLWCDQPFHPLYNRATKAPLKASHEIMWRNDKLYNLIGVLDYNYYPRHALKGSAIFLHLSDQSTLSTEGCIAISAADMRRLLPQISPKVLFHIG
jgi:L,D-peptidoglycan transpeptidase YkuD (ErfK/YbiS/YcfS/YnhG family)